jgi:hypothetical protein
MSVRVAPAPEPDAPRQPCLMLTYREILQAIADSGADYAWIGVSAAGVYGSTLSSVDFDFFIRPDPAHLDKARAAFRKLGMAELHAKVASANLILMETTDSFSDPAGGPTVDLLNKISGPSFDEVWGQHQIHQFEGLALRVASLEHIIASKLAAGREKDRYTVKRLADDLGLELKEAPAKYRVRKKRK